MAVQMIGIEHDKASIEYRELFSFHMHEAKEALVKLKSQYNLDGCVMISTCNRTELYISSEEKIDNLMHMLCDLKGVEDVDYKEIATIREGDVAIRHLFILACGMKSKIFGEDQIITQVKTALTWARDVGTADVVLEKLFQGAVTAAKKVKTKVHLTGVQTSVIENMLDIVKGKGPLHEINCLIIGNGEIGRLAARRLIEEGAKVTMTLRQYKTKEVQIPAGCHIIEYQERYAHIQAFDVIISGTSSPHHTVKYEEAHELLNDGKKRIMIDLAVPRDISSKFKDEDYVELYNIDDLGGISKEAVNSEAVEEALEIIDKYQEEFKSWYNFRVFVPTIQAVGHVAGLDVYKRIEKGVKKAIGSEGQKEIEQSVRRASEKVITSLLYGLREHLPQEQWKDCLEAIENVVLSKEY